MQSMKRNTTFAVDGYEVSATFADSRNAAAIGQVKQILLSSFANNQASKRSGDILAIRSVTRDNKGGDSHCAP